MKSFEPPFHSPQLTLSSMNPEGGGKYDTLELVTRDLLNLPVVVFIFNFVFILLYVSE